MVHAHRIHPRFQRSLQCHRGGELKYRVAYEAYNIAFLLEGHYEW